MSTKVSIRATGEKHDRAYGASGICGFFVVHRETSPVDPSTQSSGILRLALDVDRPRVDGWDEGGTCRPQERLRPSSSALSRAPVLLQ